MKTISEYVENALIIKNSKFICSLFPIISFSDISKYLEEVKANFPKATHYSYAYIFNETKKADDDMEPSRTAGMPILNVLEKEGLSNILCVVTRYFGGIKLGAGGLVRAYSKSVTNALLKADFKELDKGYLISVKTSYNNIKELEHLLDDSNVVEKNFQEEVIYKVAVNSILLDVLQINGFKCSILEECLVDVKKN